MLCRIPCPVWNINCKILHDCPRVRLIKLHFNLLRAVVAIGHFLPALDGGVKSSRGSTHQRMFRGSYCLSSYLNFLLLFLRRNYFINLGQPFMSMSLFLTSFLLPVSHCPASRETCRSDSLGISPGLCTPLAVLGEERKVYFSKRAPDQLFSAYVPSMDSLVISWSFSLCLTLKAQLIVLFSAKHLWVFL